MLKKIILAIIITFNSLFITYAVLPSTDFPYKEGTDVKGLQAIIKENKKVAEAFLDEDTLRQKSPIMYYLSKVVNYFLLILGLVAVITLIYGFSLVFTSYKSDEGMKKGYKYIQYAVIAIIIIGVSWLIAKFMFQAYFEGVIGES